MQAGRMRVAAGVKCEGHVEQAGDESVEALGQLLVERVLVLGEASDDAAERGGVEKAHRRVHHLRVRVRVRVRVRFKG